MRKIGSLFFMAFFLILLTGACCVEKASKSNAGLSFYPHGYVGETFNANCNNIRKEIYFYADKRVIIKEIFPQHCPAAKDKIREGNWTYTHKGLIRIAFPTKSPMQYYKTVSSNRIIEVNQQGTEPNASQEKFNTYVLQ